MNSHRLNAFQQEIFLDVYAKAQGQSLLDKYRILNKPTIDFILILTENDNRRRSFLEAL
jgi:hypothetical protein